MYIPSVYRIANMYAYTLDLLLYKISHMKNKSCTHLNMFCYRSLFIFEYIYNRNNTLNVIRFATESKFATKCIRDADAHLSNDFRGQSFLTFCRFHFV